MPYIYIDPQWIGGIEPFGVLVAVGVLFGAELGRRHAVRTGLNLEELRWMAFYALVIGFFSAHLVDVFLYQDVTGPNGWLNSDLPDCDESSGSACYDPWRFLKLWAGISSYGGFLGGALGIWIYIRFRSGKNKLPHDEPGRLGHAHPLAFLDSFAYGAVGGWTFGRMACAVVHDHVGKPTEFFLAVAFPPGNRSGITPPGTYHDLGLYEFLYISFLLLIFWRWLQKPRREGVVIAAFAIVYAIPRFFFEYLRYAETDPRYAGLTPAQWFSLFALGAGIYLLVKIKKTGKPAPADYSAYDVYLESDGDAEDED